MYEEGVAFSLDAMQQQVRARRGVFLLLVADAAPSLQARSVTYWEDRGRRVRMPPLSVLWATGLPMLGVGP